MFAKSLKLPAASIVVIELFVAWPIILVYRFCKQLCGVLVYNKGKLLRSKTSMHSSLPRGMLQIQADCSKTLANR